MGGDWCVFVFPGRDLPGDPQPRAGWGSHEVPSFTLPSQIALVCVHECACRPPPAAEHKGSIHPEGGGGGGAVVRGGPPPEITLFPMAASSGPVPGRPASVPAPRRPRR